ncbi:MAG: hypothetical protein LBF58_09815 [Deltaproteobacteria bacterium]|jgi:hypothetical protein|nr:hypothetical protein [Deltaproteobacteria bacterium]
MTAPLHHINQMILHLPAMGGFVAGQVGAEEELRRMARLEEAKALHRDVVEVVAETMKGEALEPLRARPERRRREPRLSPREEKPDDVFEPVRPVVDFTV